MVTENEYQSECRAKQKGNIKSVKMMFLLVGHNKNIFLGGFLQHIIELHI